MSNNRKWHQLRHLAGCPERLNREGTSPCWSEEDEEVNVFDEDLFLVHSCDATDPESPAAVGDFLDWMDQHEGIWR